MTTDAEINPIPKEVPVPQCQTKHEINLHLTEPSCPDTLERDAPVPPSANLLKLKERESCIARKKDGPLHLLDLPVDILRLIVKEVTLTNDLTSLALTNSTLYSLAVPHIYARFDIVWPDTTIPAVESKSVDALTYGLATLSLGSKFAQKTRWLREHNSRPRSRSTRLVDNQYAKFTRKFSLGKGPSDWTSEYMITKESGKMLGTLVALALAKMVNLETFVWDTPTGVLSDVFMALASLQDHYEDGQSKFEKIWIRWHDNSLITNPDSVASSPIQPPPPAIFVPPNGSTLTAIGHTISPTDEPPLMTSSITYSDSHVEYPTFSVLPPLKSLTVLDIDELAYLDEMSVLIERSLHELQELRVGLAHKACSAAFAQPWDGPHLQQVDRDARWPGESKISQKRLGGVLGVLVGRVYDIRRKHGHNLPTKEQFSANLAESGPPSQDAIQQPFPSNGPNGEAPSSLHASMGEHSIHGSAHIQLPRTTHHSMNSHCETSQISSNKALHKPRSRLDGKLRLQTLELERVPLSIQVCTRAIDWTVLTNLTILDCFYDENLWKVLRKHFQPVPPAHGVSGATAEQYHLNLKKLHTDLTSTHLINFIRETLAPNTLEVLFLQDRRRPGKPIVPLNRIFRGAIKRHRSSLKKLLLDSSGKNSRPGGLEAARRWKEWALNSEITSYITSGKMGNLKELAAAFNYSQWHPFLQRLPNIPQLRSLHVTHLLDHVAGNFDAKDLLLQIVDIITLRPEVQLCYVGIGTKCFEILETTRISTRNGSSLGTHRQQHYHGTMVQSDVEDEDEDDDDGDSDMTEEDDDVNDDDTNGSTTDAEDDLAELSDAESEAESSQGGGQAGSSITQLRLREILFYDDKVAIFKARHGTL